MGAMWVHTERVTQEEGVGPGPWGLDAISHSALPTVCPCPHGLACTPGGECCHVECLGGCSRPDDPGACVACRHFYFQGACHQACPPGTYQHESWRCVTAELCASLRSVPSLPSTFGIHQGRCLAQCPPGFTRNGSR